MDSTRPIFVNDYVDRSFDEVCELLADWRYSATPCRGRPPIACVDRIADHVARVTIFDDHREAVADLRAIAVSTGHDALTEVLVFAYPFDVTATGRSTALLRARSILDSAIRQVEPSRHAVSKRAS